MELLKKNLFFICILIVNIFLTVVYGNEFLTWTDRDLYRGLTAFREFYPLGAELSFLNGDRVPGGALNYLWGVALLINNSLMSIAVLKMVLSTLSTIILYKALKLRFDKVAVGLTATIVHYFILTTISGLWNPMFAAIFAVFSVAFLIYDLYSKTDDNNYLVFSFVFCFLSMQMHLSTSILLISLILYCFYRKNSRTTTVKIALAGFICYLPYFLYETLTGFQNTSQLIQQLYIINFSYFNILVMVSLIIILKYLKKYFFNNFIYVFLICIASFYALSIPSTKPKVNVDWNSYKDVNGKYNKELLCKEVLKCETIKSPDDLTIIRSLDLRSEFYNYFKHNPEKIIDGEDIWGSKGEYKEKFYLLSFKTNDQNILLGILRYGNIKPLVNWNNIKSIINLNLFPYWIVILVLLTVHIKVIKKDADNKDRLLTVFILSELLINFFIYGFSFLVKLDLHHKRYLFTNIITVCILFLMFFDLFFDKIKYKEKISIAILGVVSLILMKISIDRENTLSNFNDEYNEIIAVSKKENVSAKEIYNNLSFYNENSSMYVYRFITFDYLIDHTNDFLREKRDTCYVISPSLGLTKHINDDIVFDTNSYFTKTPNRTSEFKNNKFIKDNIKNITLLTKNKTEKYFGKIIYKIELKEKDYCPISYSNRYALNELEKEEFLLFNSKDKDFKIEKRLNEIVFMRKNKYLAYSLIYKNSKLYLNSNQLRGVTYNKGFFDKMNLDNFTLIVNGKEYNFKNIIGYGGVATPLDLSFNVENITERTKIKINYTLLKENERISIIEEFN